MQSAQLTLILGATVGPNRRKESRLRGRWGYTLLELMISLALLSVLITLVWGLLATFSTAQQRATRTAGRLQLLRGIRQQLEHDMQLVTLLDESSTGAGESPLVASEVATSGASVARPEANGLQAARTGTNSEFDIQAPEMAGGFSGDSEGFTCDVMLDSNPTAWLESLVLPRGSEQLAQPPPLIAASTAEVVYRLDWQQWGDQQIAFLDRGMTLDRESGSTSLNESGDPYALLDVGDLYRTDDAETEQGSPDEASTLRLGPLVDARFRYCDGSGWVTSWDSRSRGGLPVAVELSFDLPAASLKPPLDIESDANGDEPIGGEGTDSESDSLLNGPMLSTDDLYGLETEESTREFRIVIFVERSRGKPPSPPAGEWP